MKGEIVLADSIGFCWGVRRTLDIIQRAGRQDAPIATIGDVIHNPQVVQRLRATGVQSIESVAEASNSDFHKVAITDHGASPERTREAGDLGLKVIDTTCPLVTKVQRLARKLVNQGYFIVVYGDANHPEVRGILDWAETSRAAPAKRIEDLPWMIASDDADDADLARPPGKVAVISQRTKIVDEFLAFARDVTNLIAREGGEVRVCNTICAPTTERQNALERLASQVDAFLVIGGRKSSNTPRLAEVVRRHGVRSYHVESELDIDPAWLRDVVDVGVTAGASTPDESIELVLDALAARGYQRPLKQTW